MWLQTLEEVDEGQEPSFFFWQKLGTDTLAGRYILIFPQTHILKNLFWQCCTDAQFDRAPIACSMSKIASSVLALASLSAMQFLTISLYPRIHDRFPFNDLKFECEIPNNHVKGRMLIKRSLGIWSQLDYQSKSYDFHEKSRRSARIVPFGDDLCLKDGLVARQSVGKSGVDSLIKTPHPSLLSNLKLLVYI